MDEMLKKQDVLDAIYAAMEKTDKPDVVLGLAAAMSTVKQMQAAPVMPAEKQEPCTDAISREAALKCFTLNNTKADVWNNIKALPPVTSKLIECGDCVDRQAVLDAIDKWVKSMHVLIALPANEVTPLFENVRELPPVKPTEKVGQWEWVQYDYNPKLGNWHCSECRCIVVECVSKEEKGGIPLYKYCPQCGAKMGGEQNV